MATGRPTFPGRTARLGPANRRGRVSTSKLQPSTESLEVGENASRAINSFHKMVGSEWDQEVEFHGFSPAEIRLAGLKSQLLQKEADQCRADIWACKGVALDPTERANIRRHSTEGLVCNILSCLPCKICPS